jgi:hypothetical protein
MLEITFRYKDAMSSWEWREQSCIVSSLAECIRIYGIDQGDVEYEVLHIRVIE